MPNAAKESQMEGYTVPIVPPYNRIQPTPLCGPKIGGILKTRSGPSAFPLHQSSAADAGPLATTMREPSDALAGPVDVTMRRPTLSGVPAMPILAAPLVLRRAQVEAAGALAALLGRAFEAESWDAAGAAPGA